MVDDEQRGRDDAREAASKAERRVGEIQSELEDLRNQLEQVNFVLCHGSAAHFSFTIYSLCNLTLTQNFLLNNTNQSFLAKNVCQACIIKLQTTVINFQKLLG